MAASRRKISGTPACRRVNHPARESHSPGLNFSHLEHFFLSWGAINLIAGLAQFRTCLWLRAGRWISGQEAGKTPVVWEVGQQADLTEYGPAAGGEPAAPPEAGDAAQSNDGAGFFGLGWPSKGWLPKRLVHLAGRAVGFPSKRWRVFPMVNDPLTGESTAIGAAPSVP